MATLLETILVGAGLGFSLALPPGPIMAKMAFDVARDRTHSAALVGLGATTADATFFALVYFGVLRLIPDERVLGVLALAGLFLMDYFAYQAWRSARQPLAAPKDTIGGFAGGYLLAATSPLNLAWWVGSGAPLLALYGPELGLGFFPALLGSVLLALVVFRFAARRIARFETIVAYVSAGLLALFGVLLAYNALRLLVNAP